ncbi:MAG: DUF6159 family protein [Anaerolineae bacterium]|nr:DUF6159 family protein [Anaerolineae bacterium]
MWQSFQNSWKLAKASFAVLRADKELILFPLASSIATILVMIVFAVPMALVGVFENLSNNGEPGALGYVLTFLFYVVMYFVVIFANSALVGAAMIRLDGGDPTLKDGFDIAMKHVSNILGYAIIAATVGMLLRALRERGGLLAQVVAWFGEMAWNVATYLVVPVLVVEGVSPIDAVKRSSSLLKKTWGEQIAGNFGIGMVMFLIGLVLFFVVALPILALAFLTGSLPVIVLGIGLVVLMFATLGLIGSALNGIYVAAVYRYAVTGQTEGNFFSPELIQGAFRQK